MALAQAEFGPDARLSTLTPTVDGHGFCGMASWPPVEWGFRYPTPFIVERGAVEVMELDPEPYERCGRDFVAPSTVPPVT